MNRLSLAALTLLLTTASGAFAAIPVEERSLSGPSSSAPATSGPATGGAAAPAGSNPVWDQYTQMQQLQQQIAQLQGLVEQQGFLIEKLQNDLRVRYTDLDQRLAAMQQSAPAPSQGFGTPAAMGTDPAAAAPTAPSATIEEEKRAYLAAYDTFRAGGPDKAIPPMLAFVKRYPHSSFTPGAYYWLGEFYLNASTPDHAAAQKQFETVVTEYPSNAKAPAALYKLAAILDLRGKPQDAKQKMLELKQKYPQSPEAALADNYLQALDSSSAPVAQDKPVKSAAKPAKASAKVSKKN